MLSFFDIYLIYKINVFERWYLEGHPGFHVSMCDCKITTTNYVHSNQNIRATYVPFHNPYCRKDNLVWKVDVHKVNACHALAICCLVLYFINFRYSKSFYDFGRYDRSRCAGIPYGFKFQDFRSVIFIM